MKPHLPGAIWDAFRLHLVHIGKSKNQPFWRAGGTQAEKSAKFGPNGLCMLAAISKKAGFLIFQYVRDEA